ncbi:MAG: hypothetical protein OXQ94_16745 [Gemmatimonadota bacterium]|nr:hypothetical protein [Gemmatimonadota bacterium]MDE2873328.1 hypothetical protein [Gemmatimonadota bacterium]
MRTNLLFMAAALSPCATAAPAQAMQDIAVAARAGTMGLGADVAVRVHERVTVRGGTGLLGFDMDLTGRFGLDDDRTATLTLPTAFHMLGADFRLGSLRVGAGALFKSGEPAYRVTLDPGANIVIGGGTYKETEVKTLTTTLSSGAVAPYLLLGFGSRFASGFSFVADIGVALPTGVELTMAATGDRQVLESPSFLGNLDQKEKETNDDAGAFVNYWPIISVGMSYTLRLGMRRQ